MTTDELIRALRAWYLALINSNHLKPLALDVLAAADRLEEQEKIINQYHRADTFLNAHGWKWEDEKDADGT